MTRTLGKLAVVAVVGAAFGTPSADAAGPRFPHKNEPLVCNLALGSAYVFPMVGSGSCLDLVTLTNYDVDITAPALDCSFTRVPITATFHQGGASATLNFTIEQQELLPLPDPIGRPMAGIGQGGGLSLALSLRTGRYCGRSDTSSIGFVTLVVPSSDATPT